MTRRFGKPIKVVDKSRRTIRGRTYASGAEAEYATVLDILRTDGDVLEVIEQPRRVWFDGGMKYGPDFFVVPLSGDPYFVDYKGAPQKGFEKIERAWQKAERWDLVIITKERGRFTEAHRISGSASQARDRPSPQ
jgi:hypothetical protein